jgi:hypothetical protein
MDMINMWFSTNQHVVNEAHKKLHVVHVTVR